VVKTPGVAAKAWKETRNSSQLDYRDHGGSKNTVTYHCCRSLIKRARDGQSGPVNSSRSRLLNHFLGRRLHATTHRGGGLENKGNTRKKTDVKWARKRDEVRKALSQCASKAKTTEEEEDVRHATNAGNRQKKPVAFARLVSAALLGKTPAVAGEA
jgi:hypothetical protein